MNTASTSKLTSTATGQLALMMLHVKRHGLSTTAKVEKEPLKRLLLPRPLKLPQRPDRSGLWPDLDDSHFDRPDDRLCAVPGVNFFIDRSQMVFHCLLTNEHCFSYFGGRLTIG